jgi:hypothetical protein
MRNQNKEEYERRKTQTDSNTKNKYRSGWRRYFKWWQKPADRFAGLLFIATLATVVVLAVTEKTFRETLSANNASNRAFVFFRELKQGQTIERDKSTNWTFIANLENNGNTQTKNAKIGISCEIDGIKKLYEGVSKPDGTRVFGPKQIIGGGGCTWTSKILDQQREKNMPSYVGGIVQYDDIFDVHHITKYCRQIFILADPAPAGINLEHITGLCTNLSDCADDECKN